jgi:ribose transport system substrate-binding protein
MTHRVHVTLALALTTALGVTFTPAATAALSKAKTPSTTSSWQTAQNAIQAATKTPQFVGPGNPFPLRKLSGKTFLLLEGSGTIPLLVNTINGAKQAAALAGIKTLVVNGQGEPSNWSGAIHQAINLHFAGVLMTGVSPGAISSALASAKAAKVPVVDVYDNGTTTPLVPGEVGAVRATFLSDGNVMADYIVAQQKGVPTDALIFGDDSFPSVATITKGIEAGMKTDSPQTKVTYENVPVSQIGTELEGDTETDLRRDPAVHYVVAAYDAEATYIVPGIVQAGLSSTVKVVGHDASSLNLGWVQTGHVQTFDVGIPAAWGGWAGIDALARAVEGLPQQNEHTPSVAFTATTLRGKAVSNEASLYGTAYVAGYKTLWGVQ